MTAVMTDVRPKGRTLVPPELFAELCAGIRAEHPEIAPEDAATIMDQALVFLLACASTTDTLGPSDTVDRGWHVFLLRTRDYAAFCDRVAGRFLHHDPAEDPTDRGGDEPGAVLRRTVAAVKATGYDFVPKVWDMAGPCTGCAGGDPPCNTKK